MNLSEDYVNKIVDTYDIRLSSIISIIKKRKYDAVLLQFPDGLKPIATSLADNIQKKTKTRAFIWLDSCFGFCDLPLKQAEQLFNKLNKLDKINKKQKKIRSAIIHFGHSIWPFGHIVKDMNVTEI
jgi:diphthamide synthase subunit DPH2